MKIDKTNYMENTVGKFKSIPWSWAKTLTTVGMYTPCYLGGKIWKLDHVDNGRNGDTFSGYWVAEDGEHLIRISDRWSYFSKRKNKIDGLKKSKRLRPCVWSINQKPRVVEVDSEHGCKDKITVAGGYIRFDKMQKVSDVKSN